MMFRIIEIPVNDDIVAKNEPQVKVLNVLSFHAEYTHIRVAWHKRERY